MTTSKRGHAINGDLFSLRHSADTSSDFSLDVPFTSFIDVSFQGTTHQIFVAADRTAFSYENTTGEFTVGGLSGHIVELLDNVQTQVTHRYQAIVLSDYGALSTHSYESVDHVLSLIGALRPTPTSLGLTLNPNDEVEYSAAPKVALQTDVGVVEVTPLTAEVIEQLPTWEGTPVAGGQLYGGRFTNDAAYLTLVTPTCRVMVMPGAHANEDDAAETISGLQADWQA